MDQLATYVPISLTTWRDIVWALGFLTVVITARYVVLCGVTDWLLRYRLPAYLRERRVLEGRASRRERIKELGWSCLTGFIFAAAGATIGWMWVSGYTQFYLDPKRYGVPFLPISFLIYAIVHDAIYYFLHRAMHFAAVYRLMHGVHHQSRRPSVWSSFAFNPLESLAQAMILPLLLLFIPIHPLVFLLHLTFMTFTAISNHSGYELVPRSRFGHWLTGWLISGAHHAQHHRYGRSNYGLFFTWWDRALGTEHPRFVEERRKLFTDVSP